MISKRAVRNPDGSFDSKGRGLPDYCEALVRKFDYDRYLAALFAPEALRRDLLAIYALNHELARIAESVRNPIAGQIRLQWWRDRMGEIFTGAAGANEVLSAVAKAIERHRLPQSMFDRIIDAREQDLESLPFATLVALASYADATSGTVMRLASRVLGAGDALDDTARNAGIAFALGGLLRALPFHAVQSRLMLPGDELIKASVAAEQIFTGEMSPGIARLIGSIASTARAYHEQVGPVERRYLPAILPAALTPAYLGLLTKRGSNPFRDPAEIPRYRKQWIMLCAVARLRV